MKKPRESDGIVSEKVLADAVSRLGSPARVDRWLAALGRSEPHLRGMCEAGLVAVRRAMRSSGAPRDAVDAAARQLRLMSARLLAALKLADSRYRRTH